MISLVLLSLHPYHLGRTLTETYTHLNDEKSHTEKWRETWGGKKNSLMADL